MSRRTSKPPRPSGRSIAFAAQGAWVPCALAVACAPRVKPVEPSPIVSLPPAPECSSVYERVAAFDEPTALGFSAVEALSELGGQHRVPLVWAPPFQGTEYTLDAGPEQGRAVMTFSLGAAEGELVYESRVAAPWAPAETDCGADSLHIPVVVTLHSSGGALAETFETVLRASARYRAHLTQRLMRGALEGGLMLPAPESLDPARSFSLGALSLDVELWPGGSRGVLSVEVDATELPARRDFTIIRPHDTLELAAWPSDAPCPDGFHSLPSDAKVLGFAARDVLASLAREPESVRWSDGAVATLQLAFAELPAELCQTTADGALAFDATVGARSSDARVDAAVIVRIRAERGPAGMGEVTLTHDAESRAAANPEDVIAGSPMLLELSARYAGDSASGFIAVDREPAADGAQGPSPMAHQRPVENGVARGEWSR